ncbi:hypothetical protein BC826DRAFT_1029460 [Russula brevipes]|nr:hypothetical protein BC826DRAFT_1029460 [Russula brevipes]
MFNNSPPNYTEANCHHPYFYFSNDLVEFQVENTLFRVHTHFLFTYSSVFRGILRQQRVGDDTNQDGSLIHLTGVSVLQFESLLTFFYEGWQEGFSMPISKWIALLVIAHRFKFAEAELRARREVFQCNPPLDPVARIAIGEKHSVPITLVAPALEDLVRRPRPLDGKELMKLSGEMIARLARAREIYVRESSKTFTTEEKLRQVASTIVKSVWQVEPASPSGSA